MFTISEFEMALYKALLDPARWAYGAGEQVWNVEILPDCETESSPTFSVTPRRPYDSFQGIEFQYTLRKRPDEITLNQDFYVAATKSNKSSCEKQSITFDWVWDSSRRIPIQIFPEETYSWHVSPDEGLDAAVDRVCLNMYDGFKHIVEKREVVKDFDYAIMIAWPDCTGYYALRDAGKLSFQCDDSNRKFHVQISLKLTTTGYVKAVLAYWHGPRKESRDKKTILAKRCKLANVKKLIGTFGRIVQEELDGKSE